MHPPLAQAGPPAPAAIGFTIVLILIGLMALSACIIFAKYFNLWIQARLTNANVGLFDLIGMSFRKVNPNIIVRSKIMAIQAGLTEDDGVTIPNLEAHYLSGGDVPAVIVAMIAAQRAGTPLLFEHATANDLARRPQPL